MVCAAPEYWTVAPVLLKLTELVPVADKPDKAVELTRDNVPVLAGTTAIVDVLPAELVVWNAPVSVVVPPVTLNVELYVYEPEVDEVIDIFHVTLKLVRDDANMDV